MRVISDFVDTFLKIKNLHYWADTVLSFKEIVINEWVGAMQ